MESEIQKTAQKNTKKKSKKSSTKQEEEKKVVENNIKAYVEDKEEIKVPTKLNDKGIDLSICHNRKGFNIFETIAADENDEKEGLLFKKKYLLSLIK